MKPVQPARGAGPFDRHGQAYDDWFEANAELYEAELEVLRGLLPPAGVRGVEIGVGSGRFAGPLGIGIGVEPSAGMAARARARGIEVVRGVAEDLPFPGGRFDLVLMVTTICFVRDAERSLEEARRVLKPGGWILVGLVDKESELGRRYEGRRGRSRFYGQATFFGARDVLALLAGVGFEIPRIRQALIPGEAPGTILEGFGRGSFVAIQARKGPA